MADTNPPKDILVEELWANVNSGGELIRVLTRGAQVALALVEGGELEAAKELLWRILHETEAARLEWELGQ